MGIQLGIYFFPRWFTLGEDVGSNKFFKNKWEEYLSNYGEIEVLDSNIPNRQASVIKDNSQYEADPKISDNLNKYTSFSILFYINIV